MGEGYTIPQRLLIEACAPIRTRGYVAELARSCQDWAYVERSAHANGVLYQLAVVLKADCDRSDVPDPVWNRLGAITRQCAILDQVSCAGLSEIISCFGKARVPFILLKGLGIAERFYSRPFERVSVDIDILTTGAGTRQAATLLESLGYASMHREFYTKHHFHLPFIREKGAHPTSVELHWQVTKPGSHVRFDVDAWLANARPYPLRSGTVLLPPETDELLYLCHHAFVGGSVRLRDLADVARYLLASRGQARESIRQAARSAGVSLFFDQAVSLVDALWPIDGNGPSRVATGRRRQWLARHLARPDGILSGRRIWWPFRRILYWSMLESPSSGLRDLFRRTLRAPWSEDLDGPGHAPHRGRLVRFVSLWVALLLCLLPYRVFQSRSGTRDDEVGLMARG